MTLYGLRGNIGASANQATSASTETDSRRPGGKPHAEDWGRVPKDVGMGH